MSNLGILIKNNFNIMLGSISGKKKRVSHSVAILLLCLGVLGILALYTAQIYSMFEGLGKLGLNNLVLYHGVMICVSVLVILGVMRMVGTSKNNDTELLLSMPIKKRDIILSKTLNKYLFDFAFTFILFAPVLVLYVIFDGFKTSILLSGILTIFLLPFGSVGLSYIIGFLISRIFNRSRYAKLLKSLFSTLIMVVVLALILSKTLFYGSVTPASMQNYFTDRFITNSVFEFILLQDLVGLFILLAITVVVFVLGLIVYAVNYGKEDAKYNGKNVKLKFGNGKNPFANLFKKEINGYLTKPAYLINTIIGPIFIVVFSIMLCTFGKNDLQTLLGASISSEMIFGIVALVYCSFSAMTLISCCSISLEGKQLWILKSSPVNEKHLFLSKICLQLLFTTPIMLVCGIIIGIVYELAFIHILLLLGVTILCSVMHSTLGLICNLLLPKFDYTDETQVVKQSTATLLTMLLGIILVLIPLLLYIWVLKDIFLLMLIALGVYLALSLAFTIFIFTKGIKIFRKI